MHNNSMAMTTPWAYNIALYCIFKKSVFKKYHLDEARIKRWEIYHCEMVTEPIFTCFLHVSKYVAMGVGSGCPSCFTGLGIPSCVKKQPQPHVQGHKGDCMWLLDFPFTCINPSDISQHSLGPRIARTLWPLLFMHYKPFKTEFHLFNINNNVQNFGISEIFF